MLGNRKLDLKMVNSHFNNNKQVDFLHVESKEITILYNLCREFSLEIRANYSHEDSLQMSFSDFRRRIHRFFTSIEYYELLLNEHLKGILVLLVSLKPGYPDLFDNYCKPIVDQLISLKENYPHKNFLREGIIKNLSGILEEDTYVITRYSNSRDRIALGKIEIPLYKCTAFVRKSYYAKNLIFIGSPSQFDAKFSTLFFGENTYFISYDFFENRLDKKKLFQALPSNTSISTVYDDVNMGTGNKGAKFEREIGKITSDFDKEGIAQDYLSRRSQIKEADQINCKLLFLANNCYVFVPMTTRLRRIDKNQLEINLVNLNDIQEQDCLLFRNNSSVDLIMEVANEILSDKATEYRDFQNLWKSELEKLINNAGIASLSLSLQANGLEKASEVNLRNWIAPETIEPTQFELLLSIMKFNDAVIEQIIAVSNEIKSAHLRAGRQISKQLIRELNHDLLSEVEEEGFVTFSSGLFRGASFNIETVIGVYEKTITIDRKDALKVWSD